MRFYVLPHAHLNMVTALFAWSASLPCVRPCDAIGYDVTSQPITRLQADNAFVRKRALYNTS